MAKQNAVIASVLAETMANAGWMDDADELFWDIIENAGIDEGRKVLKRMNTAVAFINKHGDDDAGVDLPMFPFDQEFDMVVNSFEKQA